MMTESDASQIQIIGVIRFSFPCDGGFKTKYPNKAEHLEALFSEHRMNRRFAFFEKFCLHTLKHQTNQNFKIGVVIGDDMPARYLQRLKDITADLPQLHLVSFPFITHREAMQSAFDQLCDPDIPYKFGFRLDDDDAVATPYIETLFELAPRLLAIGAKRQPIAVAFPKGFSVFGRGADQLIVPAKMPAPPSAGMAILARSDWHHNIYRFPHHKITTLQTTLSDPSEFMYLRFIHDNNDSNHPIPNLVVDLSDQKIDNILKQRFALTLADLKKL